MKELKQITIKDCNPYYERLSQLSTEEDSSDEASSRDSETVEDGRNNKSSDDEGSGESIDKSIMENGSNVGCEDYLPTDESFSSQDEKPLSLQQDDDDTWLKTKKLRPTKKLSDKQRMARRKRREKELEDTCSEDD